MKFLQFAFSWNSFIIGRADMQNLCNIDSKGVCKHEQKEKK